MRQQDMQEQRKTERKKVAGNLPVRDVNTDQVIGYLADMSADGLMLLGEQPVPVNGLFQFNIELPFELNDRVVLHVGAECLWCRTADNPNRFWAGFHLIDISPDDQKTLEQLLASM